MRYTALRVFAAFTAALGAAGLLLTVQAAPALAAPASCEYPVAVCQGPSLTVSTTAPAPGEVIGVAGERFIGDKRITLLLRPVRDATAATAFTSAGRVYTLKSLGTRSDGTFDTSVTTPTSASGKYDLVAIKGTPRGFDDPSARLNVGADEQRRPDGNPDNHETTTAFTGFNMLWLLLLAAALVAIGWYANRRGKKTPVRSIHG